MLAIGTKVRVKGMCDEVGDEAYVGLTGTVQQVKGSGLGVGETPEDPGYIVETPIGTDLFWSEELEVIPWMLNRTYDKWDDLIQRLEDMDHNPKWDKLLFRLEYLPNEVEYWTFHDNWHGFTPLSRAMCWLGRHDYEVEEVKPWSKTHAEIAVLLCMRCGARKNSLCGRRGKR